jgi:hypothetical protein
MHAIVPENSECCGSIAAAVASDRCREWHNMSRYDEIGSVVIFVPQMPADAGGADA